MSKACPEAKVDAVSLTPLPGWIISAPAEDLENAAFRSVAALGHLHGVTLQAAVPQALWRDRLALSAAEVCVGFSGRREG